MLPVFCATINGLFEGNQQILNIHAETNKPQNFFIISVYVVIILCLFIAVSVAMAGYLAFGATVKSVIIYNLPNHDPTSITVKICYLVTIMGSFVLIAQPVFQVIERTECYLYGCCCCKAKDHPDN